MKLGNKSIFNYFEGAQLNYYKIREKKLKIADQLINKGTHFKLENFFSIIVTT